MGVILEFILQLLGGGLFKDAVAGLRGAYRDRLAADNDKERMRLDAEIAFWKDQVDFAKSAMAAGTERQTMKMNHAVFWFILLAALAPGLGTFVLLSIYNVLWWEHGIWPQGWQIAAFPPPYDQWAQMSIEWVFDPIKLAATTGVAAAGGLMAGRR